MAPHSSTLAWKIPWTEEPGRLQSMGSLRVRHGWATSLSLYTFMHWRRKWQPTPVSCLENPADEGARWAAVYRVAQVRHEWSDLAAAAACPLSRWCHPAISSSVVLFSSWPRSFPASGSFQMRQFFTSGGQSIGVSASVSVLPMNIQDWFPLGWTGWISLQSKGLSKHFLQHHSSKASILWQSTFFIVQLSHPYMTIGKTIALTRWTFVGKVMSLLFNMLSSLVITFLPRSKRLLISWLQSSSAVILDLITSHKMLLVLSPHHPSSTVSYSLELSFLSFSLCSLIFDHYIYYS